MVRGAEAMERSSVTGVMRTPWAVMAARPVASVGVGCWLVRAERSPARMERARSRRVVRKEFEKPRTPVRAATPMATERMTKKNLPREERISRAAMREAVE